MSSSSKNKLRTVADVISRLRWSADDVTEKHAIILGYEDRIHGPMEKTLQDYKPVNNGGDIPEHRIWYVRTALSSDRASRNMNAAAMEQCILWDRLGRVDRVFGSGNKGPISPTTLDHVSKATQTMIQLDQEKQERRAMKEKQRANRARKRANKAAAIHYLASKTENGSAHPALRYDWKPTPWYTYSNESHEWSEAGCREEPIKESLSRQAVPRHELTVVTWNVLFDLYDDELNDHRERWSFIGNVLERQNVDIIALQEATPAFVSTLLSQSWVKNHYAATACPSNTNTVSRSGNLLLWRKSMLTPLNGRVFVCVDLFRQCSVMACLQSSTDSPVLLLTNVHPLANKASSSDNRGSRTLARKRELAAVIGQLQKVEQDVTRTGRAAQPMIVGDFNASDQDVSFIETCNKGSFVDVWPMLEKNQAGYTFDPTSNIRAARTQLLRQFVMPSTWLK